MASVTWPMASLSFNGAATLSLRKLVMVVDDAHEFASLQWGRNFIVAEIS